MGYTHYLYQKPELDKNKFKLFTNDVKVILEEVQKLNIPICGWDGTGHYEIDDEKISFNGCEENAHETCSVNRTEEIAGYLGPNATRAFNCCKTQYKPYDLAVTSVYIALKHHFQDDVSIRSDGESSEWDDARELCQKTLGYGMSFVLD